MGEEVEKKRRPTLRFTESDIMLALAMNNKLEKPMELLYYLMIREKETPFVLILLSAQDIALETILKQEKRDTDLLFEIDKEKNLYVLLCQETKVDGGYRFAERLVRTLVLDNAHSIYCTEIEVRSTKYNIKEVIFKAIESYISARSQGKEKEIIFRSL